MDGAVGPERTCLGCGRRRPQVSLLRLGLMEGRVRPDPRRGMPGRGAYLCPSRQCLEAMMAGGRRHRAFRRRLDEAAWRELYQELSKGSWPDYAEED